MSKAMYVVEIGGRRYSVEVKEGGNGVYHVRVNDKDIVVRVSGEVEVAQEAHEVVQPAAVTPAPAVQESTMPIQVAEARAPEVPSGAAVVTSEIPGKILKVLANEGSRVSLGETIVTIESMKMELEIKASKSGVVEKIFVKPGDTVNVGDKIALIK
ncbi:MAG: biotin/lipoyl-containing protein [Zestosphaera sp.]